jgi:hypothetical protein
LGKITNGSRVSLMWDVSDLSTITPIKTRHSLSIEVFYSVHGRFADGGAMKPIGAGEVRVFKRLEGVILPAVSQLTLPACYPC